jgi:hypothetical protein
MSETPKCPCRVCLGDLVVDVNVRQANDLVAKYGWTVIGVADEVEESPDWANTVGLWHMHRLPEVSIFGLDIQDLQEWLNEAAHRSSGSSSSLRRNECRILSMI